MNLKLLKIFGICLGVLAIVFSLVVFSGSVGYYESSQTYGGDAYTGIQNAAAQSANNIMYVGETVQMALGFFLLIQGLVMLLGAICIKTKKVVAEPVMPQQPIYQQPIYQQPVSWVCPQCGATNSNQFAFCQCCGKQR
jgi:hypothetical protein